MDGISKLLNALLRLSFVAMSAFASACESSDSEVFADDGAGGTGGATSSGGSSGSSSATGGSAASGGGAGGTAATGGTQGGAGGSGPCESRTSVTLGTRMILNVTWRNTLATVGGDGVVHIWDMRRIAVGGTDYTGEVVACGIVLPPVSLSTLAGGGRFRIEIPDATWDLPSVPTFPLVGTVSGFTAGSAFAADPQTALVGLTLDPPTSPWPSSPSAISDADHDGDTKPGITSVPDMSMEFVLPPTSILGQDGDVADEVYLVTRVTAALAGEFTSCTDIEGTAMVDQFDNHVVGCHVFEGASCDDTQTNFVDANRTIYEVTSATFTSKVLDDSATCADVRAALPL